MFQWLRRLFSGGSREDERFARAVRASFGFLNEQYGFQQSPQTRAAYARWIEFTKAGVKVSVYLEVGSGPSVTLKADAAPASEPDLRREFGLHELEQEMKKQGRYSPKPAAPATIEESVQLLATTLEAIGAEVLRGDFTLLFDRQLRLVNAVRRNR